MEISGDPEPSDRRFFVHHDTERHQWQVIDRLGSKGQDAAVIAELDDTSATSERVVTRYCRQLNEELGSEGVG
jgi:hypothetical protein